MCTCARDHYEHYRYRYDDFDHDHELATTATATPSRHQHPSVDHLGQIPLVPHRTRAWCAQCRQSLVNADVDAADV